MAPATTTSVQVALRIRPITPQDAVSIPARFQRIVIHGTSETSVSVDAVASTPAGGTAGTGAAPPTAANKKQAFTFDQVHDPETGQYRMYTSTAEPLISRFLEGFNCTILAYGQTSSGKTHTMTGVDLDGDPTDPENGMGIVPRAIAEIFAQISQNKNDKHGAWDASVKGSFIEIYNEDLIDLLSTDDPNARREVQIREDKEGHIIWGGLREVSVKTVGEVMSLIKQGTSIRRTNETQMNAQSSRSHAIFSLTLTQKKYNGSGPPPRPSSPVTTPATPSRLGRPGSVIASGRVGSPTFGRPPTPSFQTAMKRGQAYARPHSSLGHSESDRLASATVAAGDWTTIVSKFHFVDLAGSERLKRTAAAGERIKEGISINSGLLALGNVISALGDPHKSKITTHIPYRDSKLTRLLQDSLGGNAHTLMIACVSPVEWNVGETVNTLKYANRARNIRNRVRIDEKEEGWDDMDWLQGTVTRLRRELKALREGAVSESSLLDVSGGDNNSNAAKQVRDQLADLQLQYVELRQKFTDRTQELTRLRREAGEGMRRSGGSIGAGTNRYEEIVGPVIEEYEKTISGMEAELSLNRAALRHTNDLLTEKEDEMAGEVERHAVTETYVDELRVRVAKLSEREAATEAYIQDLEEKIKGFSSTSLTTSDSLSSLQKELARYKDSEQTNASYIAGLEARLSKSEESVLQLRRAVEDAENVAHGREEQVKELEKKLVLMKGDEEGWRSDLEVRENKVRELEAQLRDWEIKREDAIRDRSRLGDLVAGVEIAKRDLDSSSKGSSPVEESATAIDGETTLDAQLQDRYKELEETHTATLADLSTVTDKYRDALREISDLAAQLQEAKLNQPSHSNANSVSDHGEMNSSAPITRRRKASSSHSNEPASPNTATASRRPFFAQAASTESLRTRSLSQSVSLSQELSSARSLQRSMHPTLRHQRSESLLSNPTLGIVIPHSDRTVVSLQQEIMRLQEVLKEREVEIQTLESTLQERGFSINSAEHDEDNDITKLSPQTLDHFSALRTSIIHELPDAESEANSDNKRPSIGRLDELMRSMAQKESRHRELVEDLTGQLKQVRKQHDDLAALSRDQALNMSNELDALRKTHDEVLAELGDLKERDVQLTESIKTAEQGHADDLAQLHREYTEMLEKKSIEMQSLAARHESASSEARAAVAKAESDHQTVVDNMKSESQHLGGLLSQRDAEIALLSEQHKAELTKLKAEFEHQLQTVKEDSAQALNKTDEEYYTALSKFRAQHEDELQRRDTDAAQELQRVRDDLEARIRQTEIARQGVLAESQSSQVEALNALQNEHEAALARKDEASDSRIQRLKDDHNRAIQEREQERVGAMNKLRGEHSSALAVQHQLEEEVSKYKELLKASQEEQDSVSSRQRHEFETNLEVLKSEHAATIVSTREQLTKELRESESRLEDMQKQHSAATAQLKEEHRDAISAAEHLLSRKEEEHRLGLEAMVSQHKEELAKGLERQTHLLSDLKSDQEKELITWEKRHHLLLEENTTLKASIRELETSASNMEALRKELSSVSTQHEETITRLANLTKEHAQLSQDALNHATVVNEVKQVRAELEATKVELQAAHDKCGTLAFDKTRLEANMRDLQSQLTNGYASKTTSLLDTSGRSHLERTMSHSRTNGLPAGKLPPLSPPPSIPPPPLPTMLPPVPVDVSNASLSTASSHGRHSTGSQETHESVVTPTTSVNGSAMPDDMLLAKIQSQTRLMEEQEAMIKTLNKQLANCEGDLQAHIDLVSTLESSLNDSERNLRKARNQANELTRERDALSKQLEATRSEVRDSQRELANARQSVIEQKQSLEHRLEEERKAKERARAQLDARMEELQRRKSKFACM